jgi:hypothetical protein
MFLGESLNLEDRQIHASRRRALIRKNLEMLSESARGLKGAGKGPLSAPTLEIKKFLAAKSAGGREARGRRAGQGPRWLKGKRRMREG